MAEQAMRKRVARRPVVHVRISGPEESLELIADKIGDWLEGDGYDVVEKTAPQPSLARDGTMKVFITVR